MLLETGGLESFWCYNYAVIGGLSIVGAPNPSGLGASAAIGDGAESCFVISITNCFIDSSGAFEGYFSPDDYRQAQSILSANPSLSSL